MLELFFILKLNYSASENFFFDTNATPAAETTATKPKAMLAPVFGDVCEVFPPPPLPVVTSSSVGITVADGLTAEKQFTENAKVNINVANKASKFFFISLTSITKILYHYTLMKLKIKYFL